MQILQFLAALGFVTLSLGVSAQPHSQESSDFGSSGGYLKLPLRNEWLRVPLTKRQNSGNASLYFDHTKQNYMIDGE
jgi:hypothetical protein